MKTNVYLLSSLILLVSLAVLGPVACTDDSGTPDADTDTDSESAADADSDSDSDADSDSDTETTADTNTDTEADTSTQSDSDSDTMTDTASATDSDTTPLPQGCSGTFVCAGQTSMCGMIGCIESGGCIGSGAGCTSITNEMNCLAQFPGCVWNTICSGTPPDDSCTQGTTAELCNLVDGCTWTD